MAFTKKTTFTFFVVFFTILSASSICAQTGFFEVKASNGEVVVSFSESHALIIGESEYNNGWRRLPGVKDDVVAMEALFKELGFTVKTIQDANSRDLRNGIEDFFNAYGFNQDSRLILYFAGHGETLTSVAGSKTGYIVPVDAPLPRDDEIGFRRVAIQMDQFKAWSTNYNSRHILFIFDSCFSGTVFRSNPSAPPPAINNLIARPVRQFITSGDANEEVPDQSIFRKQLEEALRNGLSDGTGYVSGTSLGSYLYTTVSNYSKGKQNPSYGKLNDPDWDRGDFVFKVITPSISTSTQVTPISQPSVANAQNTAITYYNRGITYVDQNDYNRAIEDYTQAINNYSNFIEAYFERGLAYINIKNYNAAITDYNRTIEIDHRWAEAYFNRGLAFINIKDYNAAISDFSQVIGISQNWAEAYHNRGVAYQLKGDMSNANTDLAKARELGYNKSKEDSTRLAPPNDPNAAAGPGQSEIVIDAKDAEKDIAVWVNGAIVAHIKPKTTEKIVVPNGRNTVEAAESTVNSSGRWTTSTKRQITANSNSNRITINLNTRYGTLTGLSLGQTVTILPVPAVATAPAPSTRPRMMMFLP
jgi:tetratricopeptide (TPR) repeat protein